MESEYGGKYASIPIGYFLKNFLPTGAIPNLHQSNLEPQCKKWNELLKRTCHEKHPLSTIISHKNSIVNYMYTEPHHNLPSRTFQHTILIALPSL